MLIVEERLDLDVVTVHAREVTFDSGSPAGIAAMIPLEQGRKQRSSQAPIYEAV